MLLYPILYNAAYYEQGYNQALDDCVANAVIETAGNTYTVPKDGLCTISYSVNFYNYAGNEHNSNGGSYEFKLDGTTLQNWESSRWADMTTSATITGIWSGEVKQGQVISIATSTKGFIYTGAVSMTCITI